MTVAFLNRSLDQELAALTRGATSSGWKLHRIQSGGVQSFRDTRASNSSAVIATSISDTGPSVPLPARP